MPQADAIVDNNRGWRSLGKTELECSDSGVGDDEMPCQDDFNFTEYSYFREMEIFHSAVSEKYVSIRGSMLVQYKRTPQLYYVQLKLVGLWY